MFISIPILIFLFVLACGFHWYYLGGREQQALVEAKAANKAAIKTAAKEARKYSRGPAVAIIQGIVMVCVVLGSVWLIWGGFTLLCLMCGMAGAAVIFGGVFAAS